MGAGHLAEGFVGQVQGAGRQTRPRQAFPDQPRFEKVAFKGLPVEDAVVGIDFCDEPIFYPIPVPP